MAFLVGLGDVVGLDAHGQRIQVVAVGGIERNINVFNGFLVLGIEHLSRHAERVDVIARRETVDIILERVAFVQVLDSRAEIDGVGRIGRQGFLELDNHGLVFQLEIRFFVQRWRNQHVLVGVFEGDVFVESDFYLLDIEVGAMVFGHGCHHLGRRFVLRPTCGSHRIGATLREEGRQQHREAKKQIFQFPNHGAKVVNCFQDFHFYRNVRFSIKHNEINPVSLQF